MQHTSDIPDAAAIKTHLNHLLLDSLRPPRIAVVEDKSTAQTLRILAEVALFVFKGSAVLNDIGSIAIRAVNRNPNSHTLSSNGSTYSSIG